MIISKRVKLLIRERNKSVNAFLIDIGFNHNFMNDLEKGQNPTADKIIKMANYLGVTTDYLLGLSDSPTLCRFCCRSNKEE